MAMLAVDATKSTKSCVLLQNRKSKYPKNGDQQVHNLPHFPFKKINVVNRWLLCYFTSIVMEVDNKSPPPISKGHYAVASKNSPLESRT